MKLSINFSKVSSRFYPEGEYVIKPVKWDYVPKADNDYIKVEFEVTAVVGDIEAPEKYIGKKMVNNFFLKENTLWVLKQMLDASGADTENEDTVAVLNGIVAEGKEISTELSYYEDNDFPQLAKFKKFSA